MVNTDESHDSWRPTDISLLRSCDETVVAAPSLMTLLQKQSLHDKRIIIIMRDCAAYCIAFYPNNDLWLSIGTVRFRSYTGTFRGDNLG